MAGDAFFFLARGDFKDALDAGARGLRLVRDDGELLAEQGVEQGGLAGVGAADDGDEAGADGHPSSIAYAGAGGCRGLIGCATLPAMSTRGFPLLLACLIFLSFLSAGAQEMPVRSHVVNADRSITFKYADPAATAVTVDVDGMAKAQAMAKDADGTWAATTPVMAPEIYGYSFEVDGRKALDPHNPRTTVNLLSIENVVEVPGDGLQPWDVQAVPHGEIRMEFYATHVVTGLPENQDAFWVYTPPGYDAKAKTEYPVLYLLHGFSDDAAGWTAVGRANLILDNMIAKGQAKPMLVVMPLGYGEMSFVRSGDRSWRTDATVASNVALYQQTLLTEVMPKVEAEYRVSKKREDRAIAGLSMGGLESLSIGLNNTDKFAYVGGFSSAAKYIDQTKLAGLNPKSADLGVLWIACGTEDGLLQSNRDFISFLKTKNMAVTTIETPGMHDWMVWRDNLLHFAPLLFQGK